MVLMRPTSLGGKWESYSTVQRGRHYSESPVGHETNRQLINSRYHLKVLPNGISVRDAHSTLPFLLPAVVVC